MLQAFLFLYRCIIATRDIFFIFKVVPVNPSSKAEILKYIRLIKQFMKSVFFITTASLALAVCQKEVEGVLPEALPFEILPDTVNIVPGNIDEASGIADSKKNDGYCWIQEDSGNPPEITLLSHNGTVVNKVYINGAMNRDWEDMAIGNGPSAGEPYIYIAETGDNTSSYAEYAIYRFPEPLSATDTVHTWEKIRFTYPDGSHDCEAMFVDDATKDIYLVTKRDSLSTVYRLPYPQSTSSVMTAVKESTTRVSGICGAAISPDGKEILLKNYLSVYYWKRKTNESIADALKRQPISLGYTLEPQGEAMCFKKDNSGFFTISEKPFFANHVSLNFYRRK